MVDVPALGAPTPIERAPSAPAEIAAPVGVVTKSASEEERFPFAPEPTKTERVEIDPSMRDPSLDDELSVGDQSIMEVLPDDLVGDSKTAAKEPPLTEPAPFEIAEGKPAAKAAEKPAETPALSLEEPVSEDDEPAVVAPLPIAPTPAVESSVKPVAPPSTESDIGLAKTMMASAPMLAPASATKSPEPSVEFDDPFPAIPPLAADEKERQAQQGMNVPPLFDAAAPVPAPISPDATSGVAPVSVEKAKRSRNVAIAVAVVLGLGGGVAGGLFAFERMMKGEESNGHRAVALSVDSGTPADNALPTQNTAEDAGPVVAQNTAIEDAATGASASEPEDAASAVVAQAEDAGAASEPEDAASAVANTAVEEDSGVVVPTQVANNAEPEDSGVVAPQVTAPDGVTVVAGPAGLSSPDWRIRGGARRLVKERVEVCGQGTTHGTARFDVRFDGATGRVIQFTLAGAHFRGTPVGACIEAAMRSVAIPPFTERHWDTDYAVPLR